MKYLFQSILFPLRLFVIYIMALSIFLHVLVFNRPRRSRKKKQPSPGIAQRAYTSRPQPGKAFTVRGDASKGGPHGFIEIMPIRPNGSEQNVTYHRKSGKYFMCFSSGCTPENCSLHGDCTSSEGPQNAAHHEPSDGAQSVDAEAPQNADALRRESLGGSGSLHEEHSSDASSQGYSNSICSEEPSNSVFLDEPEDQEPPSPRNKVSVIKKPVSVPSGKTEGSPCFNGAGQSREPKRARPGGNEEPSPRVETRWRDASSGSSSSPDIAVFAYEGLFLSHSQAEPYSVHPCADPTPRGVRDCDMQAAAPPNQAGNYAISDEPDHSVQHSVSAARQVGITNPTTANSRDAAAAGGETAERHPSVRLRSRFGQLLSRALSPRPPDSDQNGP